MVDSSPRVCAPDARRTDDAERVLLQRLRNDIVWSVRTSGGKRLSVRNIVDFRQPQSEVVIELDGGQHDGSKQPTPRAHSISKLPDIASCGSGTTTCSEISMEC